MVCAARGLGCLRRCDKGAFRQQLYLVTERLRAPAKLFGQIVSGRKPKSVQKCGLLRALSKEQYRSRR